MAEGNPSDDMPPKQPQETSRPRMAACDSATINTTSIAETAAAENRTKRGTDRGNNILNMNIAPSFHSYLEKQYLSHFKNTIKLLTHCF